MDQMLEQLQASVRKVHTFTEDERRRIASYIEGQTPLADILAFSPQDTSFCDRTCHEIKMACCENRALLPRLGRFLALLRHINPHMYASMIDQLKYYPSYGENKAHLSLPEIFLESGYGAGPLLHWLFEAKHMPEGISAILEEIDKDYRHDMEEYLREPTVEDLRPLAFYCAQRGQDILAGAETPGYIDRLLGKAPGEFGDVFTGRLLLAFVAVARSWGVEERFRKKLAEYLPEALAIMKDEAFRTACRGISEEYRDNIEGQLFYALRLTRFALPRVNQLMRSVCVTHHTAFLDALYTAKRINMRKSDISLITGHRWRGDEDPGVSATDQLQELAAELDIIGADRAYICAWFVQYRLYHPSALTEPFEKLYGADKEGLRHAATLAERLSRVALLCMVEPDGSAPEEAVAAVRDTLLYHDDRDEGTVLEDVEKVADWLLGEGEDTALALLPDLRWYLHRNGPCYGESAGTVPLYAPDYAALLLVHRTPVADRWMRFVLTKHYPHRTIRCMDFLHEHHGWQTEQIAAWLIEVAGAEQVLLTLALTGWLGREQPAYYDDVYSRILKENPAAAAAAMKNKGADVGARLVLFDTLYQQCPDYDEDFLIACLGDAAKKVRQHALELLLPRRDLIEKIRPLQEHKKKTVRELADQIVAAFEESADGDEDNIADLCARLLPKTGMKGIRWAIPGELPAVRWAGSDSPAEPVVVQCYLALLLAQKELEVPPAIPKIRERLNEDDLRGIARNVYAGWIDDGLRPGHKAALLMFGLHADNSDVLALQKQVEEWAQNSRGALAAQAVRAMAMGGSDLALMTVAELGRRLKNKQVRRAAEQALAAAAEALQITPEELGDRIVPTLGFDKRGKMTIDYGSRRFTATLTPALAIELWDATGKALRSLPKPGAKDNEAMAIRAKNEFAALGKNLKTVATMQAQRLEYAIAAGRRWTPEAWEKLFVQNPIMHSFACGLVWGEYDGAKLKDSFRYMEDGSFTTSGEDSFDFADVGEQQIGLVHPLDLDSDTLAAWKQQIADYDIAQPVLQLERPVYLIEDSEMKNLAVTRFAGKTLRGASLSTKLLGCGWNRGSMYDIGWFSTYWREIGEVGMQLYFSGMHATDPTDDVTVGEAAFYQAGSIQRGNHVNDDIGRDTVIPLGKVPARLFSELCLDLANATAGSTETDDNWREDGHLQLFYGK